MDLYVGSNTARSHASTLTDYSTNPGSVSTSPVHNVNQSSPGAHVTVSTVNGNVTQITRRSIFGEAPIGEEGLVQQDSKPTRRTSMFKGGSDDNKPARRVSMHPKSVSTTKPTLAAILTGSSMDDDPILKAMIIPCGERSDNDLIPIIEFIKGLRFFQIFTQYPETFKQVAQQLELQTFFKGGHVFFEGQPGNEFYIVLDGEISIVKKKRISAYSDFITENITLVKLSCGQTFGETALDSVDGLRTASAVATKRSSLLVLHRENYHKILFYFKSWLKQAVCDVLMSSTSIFHNLPLDTIHAMSARAVIRSFSINAEIVPEGGRVSSLMIVKSGIVRLVKSISKYQVDQSVQGAVNKFDVGEKITNALASPPPSPLKTERDTASHTASASTLSSSSPLRLPSLISPTKTITGSAARQTRATHTTGGKKGNRPHSPPPGYWLLADSTEYLDAARPLRVVTKDIHTGTDTITEIHRGSLRPNIAER